MTDGPSKSPPVEPPDTDSTQEEHPEEDFLPDFSPPDVPPSSLSDGTGDEEPPEGGEQDLGGAMTFLEHLDELRKRILHSASAVAITFVACWTLREEIFRILALPIADVVAPGQGVEAGMKELIFLRPTDPFSIWMKVAFVGAIFTASPYILFQIWLFIAPGLYRKEKSYAVPFLVSSTLLFLLGGVFAYFIILPTALDFLINQFGRLFRPMVSALEFFNFEVIILVGMGAVFQLPVLIAFLSLFGLVTPGFLWRNFRYAFLIILIVAAVVSPTADVLNLFLWSGPMVALYLVSIIVSWIFQRKRAREGK